MRNKANDARSHSRWTARTTGRKTYREVCGILQRHQSLFGIDQALSLANELRKKYLRLRTMAEELNSIVESWKQPRLRRESASSHGIVPQPQLCLKSFNWRNPLPNIPTHYPRRTNPTSAAAIPRDTPTRWEIRRRKRRALRQNRGRVGVSACRRTSNETQMTSFPAGRHSTNGDSAGLLKE